MSEKLDATESPQTPITDLDEPRPRLQHVGFALLWLVIVVVLILCLIVFAPRVPNRTLQNLLGIGGLLLSVRTVWFVLAFVACVAIAIVAGQTRHRWQQVAATLTAVLALLVVTIPWVAAWRTADQHGESVSWASFSDDGPHASPTQTTPFETVDGQQLRLDVYRPLQPARSRPAIVYVHGGGFARGSRADNGHWLAWLAAQGATVFSIDYRLAPPPRWQQATGDVKCALGWVRQHAGAYGVAPENVSVAGDSAGANLALMAAYTVGDAQFPPSCPTPQAPVRSVISLYAPTDLPSALDDTRMPVTGRKLLDDYLGGSVDSHRDRYLAASPTNHVKPGLPTTFLAQGGSDHLVPPDQADKLAVELGAVGVPVTTLDVPWADHGFTAEWGGWGSQILRPELRRFIEQNLLN